MKADYTVFIRITFLGDHQIGDIHKITPKTDMLDQIVKTISTETIIPDHNPIEITTLLIAETFHTQTPRNRNYSNDRSINFSSNRF